MDGMPDAYEDANRLNKLVHDSGLDADLDGFTNGQEFTAGTDPQDVNSFLKIEEIDIGSAIIRFIAQPGKTYAVQYRDAVVGGSWIYLDGLGASSDPAHLVEVVDGTVLPGTKRFYRLVTPGTTASTP